MCNDGVDVDYDPLQIKKFESNHECENYSEVCCSKENVIEITGL